MKTSDTKMKTWVKPEVHVLNIKKNTHSGTSAGPEGAGYQGPPGPPVS